MICVVMIIFSSIETQFARWHIEQVINWLYGIGLGQYATELRKYFKNGLQLLNATSQELEKVPKTRNKFELRTFCFSIYV